MLLNKLLPFAMDAAPPGVSGEGVGGARKRMKKPNFSMSLIASRAAGGGVFVVFFRNVVDGGVGGCFRPGCKKSVVGACSPRFALPRERGGGLLFGLPSVTP